MRGAGLHPRATACAQPLPESQLTFPSEPVIYPALAFTRQSVLYRPAEGTGPFPAVVLLHTCGGIGPHMFDWAQRLTRAGYVALVVDSNSPRKIINNCQGAAAQVTVDQVASDAAAAMAHLRGMPFVMPDRLAVMGFSWGAMASLRLASYGYQQRVPGGTAGLRAIAFFYGTCGTDWPNPAAQASSTNLLDDNVTRR